MGNFYKCFINDNGEDGITYDNKQFRTAEAIFQYIKYKGFGSQTKLDFTTSTCGSGDDAIEKSRKIKGFPPNWHGTNQMDADLNGPAEKLRAMRIALYHKFSQFEVLRVNLVNTDDAYLIECTCDPAQKRDSFWATDNRSNGKVGQNMLGRLLMELRAEFGGIGIVKCDILDTRNKVYNSITLNVSKTFQPLSYTYPESKIYTYTHPNQITYTKDIKETITNAIGIWLKSNITIQDIYVSENEISTEPNVVKFKFENKQIAQYICNQIKKLMITCTIRKNFIIMLVDEAQKLFTQLGIEKWGKAKKQPMIDALTTNTLITTTSTHSISDPPTVSTSTHPIASTYEQPIASTSTHLIASTSEQPIAYTTTEPITDTIVCLYNKFNLCDRDAHPELNFAQSCI